MCTLVIGRDVMGTGTLWVAANRDEDPTRPSDPPGILIDPPRIVGGRDRVSGGTWLAIRERRAVVAMLNRRDLAPSPAQEQPALRSRGLLALDVARADVVGDGEGSAAAASGERPARAALPARATGPLARAALACAERRVREDSYAPFSLVFLSLEGCWLLIHEGADEPRLLDIPAGWHVLTHDDLDDPSEPRTAWLMKSLQDWRPTTLERARQGLIERLRDHGGTDGATSHPAVCLHAGRMVTVSSSLVHLAPDRAHYFHAEGRPCENPFADYSTRLGRESDQEGT